LYDVPLHGVLSLPELREKAILAYMKNVLKIPMETNKDKDKLNFFEKQDDGSYKLNLGEEKVIVQVNESLIEQKSDKTQKKGLSDFIQNVGQSIANGILSATGNKTVDADDNKGMPSADDLLNNQ
jgi:hypothetical protein